MRQKEKEIERQTAEDANRLEAEAQANNDFVFTKLENRYLNAEKESSEFIAYALKNKINVSKDNELKLESDLKRAG